MSKEQLDQAIALGFTTQSELKAFEFGIICADTKKTEENIKAMQNEIDDNIEFLTNPDWKPTSVTHYTNRNT